MKSRGMLDALRTLRDRLARRPLGLSEFTALFEVTDAAALEQLLGRNDREPPAAFERVLGLHDLRSFVFTPLRHNDVPGVPDAEEPRVLVLACAFDGEVDDVLAGLAEHARGELGELLRHCVGFDESAELTGFLKQHRVESGYLFRDLGPIAPDDDPEGNLGDATRVEIEQAFELEERFERFYAEHPVSADAGATRRDFVHGFSASGFPLPLTDFERALPDEARWARRASELMRRMQVRAARQDGVRRRAAHAKTHALLPATFRVERGIPESLRIGLFAEPGREYRAWLRSSNGSEHLQGDAERDARGFALSVELTPASDPAELASGEGALALPQIGRAPRQDFVLFSHPTFFASDVRRFVMLVGIAMSHWSRRVLPGLAFGASRAGLREVRSLVGALSRRVTHPLAPDFHSGTAYLLGARHVVKYSAEPADPSRFARFALGAEPDFLRTALRQSLELGPLEVRLYAHVFAAEAFAQRPEALIDLVEDATVDWRQRGAKRVHVATVLLERALPVEGESLPDPETSTFNPWNALAVHRPLGSLNRARWLAYGESAAFRQRGAATAPSIGAATETPGSAWVPSAAGGSSDAAE